MEEEASAAMDYMDKIIKRKSEIKRLLDNAEAANKSTTSLNGTMGGGNAHSVKLPKLVIERFSSDVSAWQSFWNQFESAIHDNPSLSIMDKFNYLKSLLSGVAANVVAGLSLSAENEVEDHIWLQGFDN